MRYKKSIALALIGVVVAIGAVYAIFTEEGVWIGEEPDQTVGIQREGGHLTFRDEQNTTARTLSELLSSAPAWGSITGTLSNQTDLQNALNGKLGVTLTDPQDGQILVRQSGVWANYTPPSLGGGVWGSITGTLSNQTDLSSALSGKLGTGAQAADSALLGGQNGAYYLNPANLSTAVPKTKGGFGTDVSAATGVPTFVTGTLSWITTLDDGYIPSGITRDTEWDTWAEHPALTSAYLVIGNASNQAAAVAMSGDITISNAGVTTIGNDKVLEAHLKAVDTPNDEEYLTYESTTGDFEWQTIPDATTSVKGLASFSSSHFSVSSGAVSLASAVTLDTEWDTWAEHPALNSANIIVGNASNQPAAVAMSGDATIANTGAVTVADNSHAHTGSTLSGVDISDDTNLAVTAPITKTGDTIGIDNSTFAMLADAETVTGAWAFNGDSGPDDYSIVFGYSGGTDGVTLGIKATDGSLSFGSGGAWAPTDASISRSAAGVVQVLNHLRVGIDNTSDDYLYLGGSSIYWDEDDACFRASTTFRGSSFIAPYIEASNLYCTALYGHDGANFRQGMTATVSGSNLSNASTIVIVDGLIISAS